MEEVEEKLNISEDFANIDDLLDDVEEDKETTNDANVEDVKMESSVSFDERDDGFDNDRLDTDLGVATVPKEEEGEGVFSSGLLDNLLGQRMEVARREIFPANLAMEGITEVGGEQREVLEQQLEARDQLEGLRAGLGQQTKTRMKMKTSSAAVVKVKTLAMKREQLQEDIMKYGVAAIERLYPRQPKQQQARRKSTGTKRESHKSPYKMKPLPQDLHFEEVDARRILRPLSHDKYIKEPAPGVVYVARREGLVPLHTLQREGKLLLSSSPRLLAGRNLALGKPGHYVRQDGRLVAVGGTRNKTNAHVKIVKVPSFDRVRSRLPLFQLDEEMASFACQAVRPPASGPRVDVRALKRVRKREKEALDLRIGEQSSLVDKMMIKLDWNKRQEEEQGSRSEFDAHMEEFKQAKVAKEDKTSESKETNESDDFKSFNMGRMEYQEGLDTSEAGKEDVGKDEASKEENVVKGENDKEVEAKVGELEDEFSKDDEEEGEEEAAEVVVKNSWSSTPRNVVPEELNMDECPPLRGYSAASIRPLHRTPVLTFDGYTGVDACDLAECFCKEPPAAAALATPLTGSHSGSQTPAGTPRKGPQRIAKDLLRVKRALKTLGVKIIEFDEHEGGSDTCTRDYCRLGCICDSLRTKQIPPSHCGKVDCMFACCCSKEALKYSSCGSRRVNISAAVGARIQEDSQRNMAVEERKFSNTVVVTSDRDAVMLGGRSGRGTRRERKLPQRYQNSNTLMLDVAGKEYVEKEEESGDSELEDEEAKVDDAFLELKREQDISPCTVLVPKVRLPASCSVWCMFHCQYSCPCYKLRNPLDYGPDRSKSRNVAKRSLGNSFTTRRKSANTEEKTVNVEKAKGTETSVEDEDQPLLGVEDIDPDFKKTADDAEKVEEGSKTEEGETDAKKARVVTSARTRGAAVQQTARLKLPHRKRRRRRGGAAAVLPDLEEVVCLTDSSAGAARRPVGRQEAAAELAIALQPREARQYVRWDLFKRDFAERQRIDLWFWVQPARGRNMVFLTARGARPYIATAINLRNLQGRTSNLPGLVSECLRPVQEQDARMYVVLESNGKAWALVSILANRREVGEEQVRSLTLDTPPPPPLPESRMKVQDGSVKVSLAEAVQKLPLGQSLVTVTEGGRAVMQVKLPPTLVGQYWSLISVGAGQASIQCPDSSLVLKCAILQQAATLATATSTTVRIPIPVAEQDASFGVYAVPGLQSHVFVGPFKAREQARAGEGPGEEDEDIVCLDDEISKKDSEEVKALKKAEEAEKAVKKKELKDLAEKTKQLGQVPRVVAKEDANDEVDVDVVEDVVTAGRSAARDIRASLAAAAREAPLPPASSRLSDHGKVVVRPGNAATSGTMVDIKFARVVGGEEEEEVYKAVIETSGAVSLAHPGLPQHAVICPSVPAAKLWLEHFHEEAAEEGVEEAEEEVTPPPPVLRLLPTPSLPSGKSTEAISLFLQTREQKDEAALFYELGHTAFTRFFQKTISRAQILVKAKEEIGALTTEGAELEATKAALLKRRTNLFDDFTKSLTNLPVARKKAAVIELKELLKRDKEPRVAGRVEEVVERVALVPGPIVVSSTSSPTPYTDVTGIHTVRADGSVLRPMNAFMLWAKERRVDMMRQGVPVAEVSQALSEQWKGMGDEEKSRYYKEQEHLKELHRLQHPDYKYSPRIRAPAPAAPSPPPTSPNQPAEAPEEQEPNQPPAHSAPIQVPRPLAQLRGQPAAPRPILSRPAPPLLPVQTYTRTPHTSSAALLSPKPTATTSKPILNIPSRSTVRMSSTFTPAMAEALPEAMEQEEQDIPVLSLPEQEQVGGLDLLDLPPDAADMLGLAVHSSGLQLGHGLQDADQQYIIQGDSITPIASSDLRTLNIGGESYEVVEDEAGGLGGVADFLPNYHEEQQLLLQQEQQQEQPVFVDQYGRQLLLSPEQQLLIQQQLAAQQQQVVYQDQDQDQQLVYQDQEQVQYQDQDQVQYQDQDVMTID